MPELIRGPVVQSLHARGDDAVVEHSSEAVLGGEVFLEVARERIAVWKDPAQREECSCHPEPRIAEEAAEWSQSAERQAGRCDERVGVENADQGDVEEEALRHALQRGEIAVLQVGGDHACVVRAIPAPGRWPGYEGQPVFDGRRRRLAGQAG